MTMGQAVAISVIVLVPVMIVGRLLVLRSRHEPLTRSEGEGLLRGLVVAAIILLVAQLPLPPSWIRIALVGFAAAFIVVYRRGDIQGRSARFTANASYAVIVSGVILLAVWIAVALIRGSGGQ